MQRLTVAKRISEVYANRLAFEDSVTKILPFGVLGGSVTFKQFDFGFAGEVSPQV